MPAFEEFAKQFDITKPEEFVDLLKQYQGYLNKLWDTYDRHWTFCCGCHKTVRYDCATHNIEDCGGVKKMVTRCPECGMVWFIRKVES